MYMGVERSICRRREFSMLIKGTTCFEGLWRRVRRSTGKHDEDMVAFDSVWKFRRTLV